MNAKIDLSSPGFMRRGLGNPDIDWMHSTTPQSGANNRSVILSRYACPHHYRHKVLNVDMFPEEEA